MKYQRAPQRTLTTPVIVTGGGGGTPAPSGGWELVASGNFNCVASSHTQDGAKVRASPVILTAYNGFAVFIRDLQYVGGASQAYLGFRAATPNGVAATPGSAVNEMSMPASGEASLFLVPGSSLTGLSGYSCYSATVLAGWPVLRVSGGSPQGVTGFFEVWGRR